MYPKIPTISPQIKIPIESLGICTNICDQSSSLVKIATKIPENPIKPPNPRIWYDKNPRLARMSISEVTLMLKANPTKIPAKKIKKSVFLKFSFSKNDFVARMSAENAVTLTNISAGSSFISFAC